MGLVKKFIEENRSLQLNSKPKTNVLLSGSILSSAVFIGSVILYPVNEVAGVAGIICSAIAIGITVAFRNR